jgi:hypothetical protein
MNRILACCITAISCCAAAQSPPAAPAVPVQSDVLRKQACADCGEIRSIRRIEREQRPQNAVPESPSGLVATIPLGPGGGKPTVGSSTRADRLRDPPLVTYEVIVKLDDGRFRVLIQDDEPEGLQMGDRVRIEDNKVRPR